MCNDGSQGIKTSNCKFEFSSFGCEMIVEAVRMLISTDGKVQEQ
jgi:hypothetical protein